MAELVEWSRTRAAGAVDFFDRALDELKAKGLVVDQPGTAPAPGTAARPALPLAPPAPPMARPVSPAPPLAAPRLEPATAQVPPASTPPTAWTWATYAWALLIALGVGYFLVRGPLQVSDSIGNIVKVAETSLGALIESELGSGPYMRPGLWAMFKIAFAASGGAYHAMYTAVHAGQIVLLALLFARLLAVRTAGEFVLAPLAFAMLIGMHTFGGFVLEAYPVNTFTTIAIYVLAALNLTESRTGWLADLAAPVLLVVAMFTLESGLLVWVALMTAYLAGARGVSARGMSAATLIFVGYFVFRFVLGEGGTPGLDERSTGYGFRVLDPEELQQRFGANPLVFYAYNVASSIVGVLFAEPRNGVWEFTREFTQPNGEVRPWMTINVATSALTSLVILAYSLRRVPRWARLRVQPRERLVIAFWGVMLANAVMSFAYTKDQIMSISGCLYALAAFVAWTEFLRFRWINRPWLSPVVALVLVAVAVGWTFRAVGLHYNLTVAAHRHRQDWIDVREWMSGQGIAPGSQSHVIVNTIEQESLAMPVPHPYFIYGRFGSRYFDQH
jgi:hypothetical protein